MPIPVIVTDASVHLYAVGEYFVYQPAASESPTSWAAAGLPAGITINAVTGKISGFGTEPGFYNVSITATNGSGPSLPLVIPIGLERSNLTQNGSTELNVDLSTFAVSNPGIGTPIMSEGGLPVLLWMKKGDTRLISVGYTKGKFLQQLPIASVLMAMKEFDDERRVVLSDGLFEQVGSYDTARFQIAVPMDRVKLKRVLANYQGDKVTFFDAAVELRWGLLHTLPGAGGPSVLENTSQTFAVRVIGDIAPDIVDEE